jgi:hypothetical protein
MRPAFSSAYRALAAGHRQPRTHLEMRELYRAVDSIERTDDPAVE